MAEKPPVRPRTPRPLPELVERLREHVELLAHYCQKLSETRESKWAGEIAGKLRVLVASHGRNKPLLLGLMKLTEANIVLELDLPPLPMVRGGPIAPRTVSLEEFLKRDAIWVRLPSGEVAKIKRIDLFLLWAQQAGAAHEDWSMDDGLRSAILAGQTVIVGGWDATYRELLNTGGAVAHVASLFLAQLDDGTLSLPA